MIRKVIIGKKEWYNRETFGLELHLPGISPLPGQFFQVRVDDNLDPFLNRPISVASYRRGKLLLIIRVVGKGTALLSRKRAGENLTILGPYGNGVKVKNRGKSLIVAGGIGVAPLYYLAQHLKKKKIDFTFIYGVKSESDFILKKEIKKMSSASIFVSEKGGGKRMTALDVLKNIEINDYKVVYACGPKAMLIELQKSKLPLPVYAFCEDVFGCGCGLCLGCAIRYRGKYRRVCEDGPVFELKDIEFND